MDQASPALLLDLLEWIAAGPRPYEDVMEAWRTSCPRLPVWEDAMESGLVMRKLRNGPGVIVDVTPLGRRVLAEAGRLPTIPS